MYFWFADESHLLTFGSMAAFCCNVIYGLTPLYWSCLVLDDGGRKECLDKVLDVIPCLNLLFSLSYTVILLIRAKYHF